MVAPRSAAAPRAPDSLHAALRALVEAGQIEEARRLIREEQARGDEARSIGNWPALLVPPAPYAVPGCSRGDLRANIAWYEAHQAEYPGEWVALRDGALVDHDRDFRALDRRLRARGIDDALWMECGGGR